MLKIQVYYEELNYEAIVETPSYDVSIFCIARFCSVLWPILYFELWGYFHFSLHKLHLLQLLFAVEVLRAIGLSPCQKDHAFESTTTIKVITMQILWPSSSLWKVRDPVTKELRNHFEVRWRIATYRDVVSDRCLNSEWDLSRLSGRSYRGTVKHQPSILDGLW